VIGWKVAFDKLATLERFICLQHSVNDICPILKH